MTETYPFVWMDHMLLVCSSAHEHLSCFCFGPVMSNAAVNIHEQVFKWACALILSGIYPEAELLCCIITLCLTFWGTKILSFKATWSLTTSPSCKCFLIIPKIYYWLYFKKLYLPWLVQSVCHFCIEIIISIFWWLMILSFSHLPFVNLLSITVKTHLPFLFEFHLLLFNCQSSKKWFGLLFLVFFAIMEEGNIGGSTLLILLVSLVSHVNNLNTGSNAPVSTRVSGAHVTWLSWPCVRHKYFWLDEGREWSQQCRCPEAPGTRGMHKDPPQEMHSQCSCGSSPVRTLETVWWEGALT